MFCRNPTVIPQYSGDHPLSSISLFLADNLPILEEEYQDETPGIIRSEQSEILAEFWETSQSIPGPGWVREVGFYLTDCPALPISSDLAINLILTKQAMLPLINNFLLCLMIIKGGHFCGLNWQLIACDPSRCVEWLGQPQPPLAPPCHYFLCHQAVTPLTL